MYVCAYHTTRYVGPFILASDRQYYVARLPGSEPKMGNRVCVEAEGKVATGGAGPIWVPPPLSDLVKANEVSIALDWNIIRLAKLSFAFYFVCHVVLFFRPPSVVLFFIYAFLTLDCF